MAESNFVKKLEQVFECSICLQIAVEPKLLTCYHTFCAQCIQSTYDQAVAVDRNKHRQITCPLCKNVSHLTSGDLTCLPSDFRANNVTSLLNERSSKVEEENRRVDCYVCQKRKLEREATALCFDCAKPFCQECYLKHNAKENFADHAHSVMLSADKKSVMCAEHGEFFQNFCTTCDCSVCSVCMLTDHDDHHTVRFARLQQSDADLLKITHETETHLQYLLRRIPILQTEGAMRTARTKERICNSKQSLIDAIEQYANQLLVKIDSESRQMEEDLIYITEKAAVSLAQLQDLKLHLESTMKPVVQTPDVKIVDTLESIEGKTKELCSAQYVLPSHKDYLFEGFDGVIFGSLVESKVAGVPPVAPERTRDDLATYIRSIQGIVWNDRRGSGTDLDEDYSEEHDDSCSVGSPIDSDENDCDSSQGDSDHGSGVYPDGSDDQLYFEYRRNIVGTVISLYIFF